MLACAKGHFEVIKRLVEAGASLTLTNKDGWTPFHIACRTGDIRIIRYFLALNEDIWQSKSYNGRTPLHTAGWYF